jgi:hypothetical protein
MERLEYPDDADEPISRAQLDDLAEETELDHALLRQAQIELRESEIFPGVPLS